MSDYLFTSESASEGHPDKLADRISDAILDRFLERDPAAKVACETFVAEFSTDPQTARAVRRIRDRNPRAGGVSESGAGWSEHADHYGRAGSGGR